MRPEQWVRVVVDPDDDPHLSDALEERADVVEGTVVVRPVPGATTPGRFAGDLLVALGKHIQALRWERQTYRSWPLAVIWLRAERPHHLVVLDADRLAPELCTQLAELAAAIQLRLWLVARREPSPGTVLHLWREWTITELLAHLPGRAPAAAADLPDGDIDLPDAGFLTFRAACSQRLTPEHFASVDVLYRQAFGAARAWNRDAALRRERPVIAAELRTLTTHSVSAAHTRIRLRATQAAHLVDGSLVRLAENHWPARIDVPHVGLGRPLAQRLRRIVTPAWACALTLRAATARDDGSLLGLRMKAVSQDGRRVRLCGDRFDVPSHAAAMVRAQLVARQAAGARPNHPLFVDDDGREFRSRRQFREGLELALERGARWWSTPLRWPLSEDYATPGYSVRVHALDRRRSIAARVRTCIDLMAPDQEVCTALCGPLGGAHSAALGQPIADMLGLVSWHQGRLRPSADVEFSLCLTHQPPSLSTAAELPAQAIRCDQRECPLR